MKYKEIHPNQILTLKDFPVHNEQVLKIYFRICSSGHKQILPPTPVIEKAKGLPLLEQNGIKAEKYNQKLINYLNNNPQIKYFLLDGSHKTTALCLTRNKINCIIFETDEDIKLARAMVETGELFSLTVGSTIKKNLEELAEHFSKAKIFETVEDKTKRMVKEKVIPQYMIEFYNR